MAAAKGSSGRDQSSSGPYGDVYAKVRGDKPGDDGESRGDKLIKVGAVWTTKSGHLEFTIEAEPLAWQRQQPGATWPQLRSFIVMERKDR